MDLLPKVFRTEGDVVSFEPIKIEESIIKETNMNEKDARHVTELVVRRIISSGIKFLSGPHIREIVCSILSENHFEQERKLYTRIGMPLMDYEQILEKGRSPAKKEIINPERIHHWAADQLAEEYTLLRILNDQEAKSHLYGDIHIHKLKYFDLRPLNQIWDPRIILKNGIPPISYLNHCCKSGPADNLKEATHHLAIWLGMMQSEFCGNQGFNFITTFLAPFVQGLKDDQIFQDIKNFIYEINQLPNLIGRNIPYMCIYTSPSMLESFLELPAIGPHGESKGVYGDYIEANSKLFNIFIRAFINGDFLGNPFNYLENRIIYTQSWLEKFQDQYSNVWEEILKFKASYLQNLCSNWVENKFKEQDFNKISNKGILQTICLNLPRIAYENKDEDLYFERLEEKMKFCAEILLKKYTIILKRLKTHHLPLCSGTINNQAIYKLEDQKLGFSFVGLNEAVKFLTDYELHEHSEAFNFGKKILLKIQKYCSDFSNKYLKNYTLIENASKKAIKRFVNLDKKHFPKYIEQFSNINKNYYTNSAHFRENAKVDIFQKILKQGEYHQIIQNQIFEKVSLTEFNNLNIDFNTFIKRICVESNIA
jgi:anaerobic ribonucleoside-triphosphate reductase